ncbi:MAG TPA: glycoside hydrolase TIM-barrel-like domain-containing protein [Bacteroidota bacterium]|jgi:hypothetical protein|nr:glycoside hydrolase TIM-barrel-like domain-containing protein [Bacteroidota bacterium]
MSLRFLSRNSLTALVAAGLMILSGCGQIFESPNPPYVVEMRGFTYTSFAADGFQQGGDRNSLGTMRAQVNNNWVALAVFEYQSSTVSPDIAPNTSGTNPLNGAPWATTSTLDDLREGVREARANGMKIMLKPQVDLYSGDWRASVIPDERGLWFASYTAMIEKYATLARELNIEMICIGTEYIGATQPKYTAQWRAMISKIRALYPGKLTYAANWSGNSQIGIVLPEFQQVDFWSDLDYIGVDAYYPLTDFPNDTIPTFAAAMYRALSSSGAIDAVASQKGKPVLITEIGIQSVRGALAAPWDYSLGAGPTAVADSSVQKFYYQVFIDAFGKQYWCAGMFWWHWESVASTNVSTNYTPESKPAAETLRLWYSSSGL